MRRKVWVLISDMSDKTVDDLLNFIEQNVAIEQWAGQKLH